MKEENNSSNLGIYFIQIVLIIFFLVVSSSTTFSEDDEERCSSILFSKVSYMNKIDKNEEKHNIEEVSTLLLVETITFMFFNIFWLIFAVNKKIISIQKLKKKAEKEYKKAIIIYQPTEKTSITGRNAYPKNYLIDSEEEKKKSFKSEFEDALSDLQEFLFEEEKHQLTNYQQNVSTNQKKQQNELDNLLMELSQFQFDEIHL